MSLEDELRRLAVDVRDMNVDAALVGGLAVSVRTEPRFTRDIDLAIAVTGDTAAENLVRAFLVRGYSVIAQVEHEDTGRLATVRLRAVDSAPGAGVVDLLFASSGIEPEIVAAADPIEIVQGVVLHTAQTGHLIATKLLARDDRSRPQDAADLMALIAVADPHQRAVARDACRTIVERGFGRGRDLSGLLEAALRAVDEGG